MNEQSTGKDLTFVNPAVDVEREYRRFEQIDGIENLFLWRLKIDDAMARLVQVKRDLDEELIRRMKDEGKSDFETMIAGKTSRVWYAPETKKKLKNTRVLINMLLSNKGNIKDLAFGALSNGQQVWKMSKVEILCDTLGIKREEMIEVEKGEKIKVESAPLDILEANK